MKKLLLSTLALSCAGSVFAQGTMFLNNRVANTLVTVVYAPFASNNQLIRSGNSSTNTPAGSTDYTGFTLIGAGGTGGAFGASTTLAQLFGNVGPGQAESSLQPAAPITTFRTGAAAGQLAANTATFGTSVPGDSPLATVQLRVWDNSSGLYPTWAQAETAWLAGLIAAGKSPLWNQDKIGGQANPPPNMINSLDASQSLKSFNIYFTVPEPSTIALAGLGAASLLIFRRRKQ